MTMPPGDPSPPTVETPPAAAPLGWRGRVQPRELFETVQRRYHEGQFYGIDLDLGAECVLLVVGTVFAMAATGSIYFGIGVLLLGLGLKIRNVLLGYGLLLAGTMLVFALVGWVPGAAAGLLGLFLKIRRPVLKGA